MRPPDRLAVLRLVAVAFPALAAATIAVALFEAYLRVPNASSVYLAAVVLTAFVAGTWGAVIAAVASFVLYDFLFVQPLHTLDVEDPGEYLNLVLLLFIGIVVGQLVASQRPRAGLAPPPE